MGSTDIGLIILAQKNSQVELLTALHKYLWKNHIK